VKVNFTTFFQSSHLALPFGVVATKTHQVERGDKSKDLIFKVFLFSYLLRFVIDRIFFKSFFEARKISKEIQKEHSNNTWRGGGGVSPKSHVGFFFFLNFNFIVLEIKIKSYFQCKIRPYNIDSLVEPLKALKNCQKSHLGLEW
jgi:hypothetical protein